jgi:hypothetical protein
MAQRFLAAGDCGGERKKKKWEVREGMDRSDPKDKGNPYKWAAPRFVQRSGEWRNFRHASVRTVVIVGFFSTTPRKSRAGETQSSQVTVGSNCRGLTIADVMMGRDIAGIFLTM